MQRFISANVLRLLAMVILLTALLLYAPSYQQARARQAYVFYLPQVLHQAPTSTATPGPITAPEQLALDRINFYRDLAGVQGVQAHTALMTAATNHATYDLLNANDSSAWANGPHGEVAGKPGYTGRMPGDRAVAAGYPWSAGWEVMDHFDDPTRSVDALMMTVFHRVNILLWTHQYAGYGHGRSGAEYVDVLDFGRGPIDPGGEAGVVVFPAANETDVPLYGTTEQPSPVPPGAPYPIGYPITIQPVSGTVLMVSQAELRDHSGALVSVYPSPDGCATTCYALIPTAPLTQGTTYTVHVEGTVDQVAFDTTWSFTTRRCTTPLDC